MIVLIVHGPNLDQLGARAPEIYGAESLDDIDAHIKKAAGELGMSVEIHQTASEARFIELLRDGVERVQGAIVNPAVFSHYSLAIADAIREVPYPVIEVHISNIHGREEWRRRSVTAEAAAGVVAGFRSTSYTLALRALQKVVG